KEFGSKAHAVAPTAEEIAEAAKKATAAKPRKQPPLIPIGVVLLLAFVGGLIGVAWGILAALFVSHALGLAKPASRALFTVATVVRAPAATFATQAVLAPYLPTTQELTEGVRGSSSQLKGVDLSLPFDLPFLPPVRGSSDPRGDRLAAIAQKK